MKTNTIQQQLPINEVLHGDCIEMMREIPANSVDFILTDPPYLVNYRDRDGRTIQNDARSDWLKPAMREAYRILKQDRVAVMFYGWTKVDMFFDAWKEAGFHGMLEALRGPTPSQAVRRYQLTVEGRKYFQQVPTLLGKAGGFCYGQKTVDSVLKWGNPVTMGSISQVEVTYTYKFSNLAAWAERSDVKQAFPDIGAIVTGASKTHQIVGIQLTNNGWEVSGR
jgi:hypothetical protein